MKIRAVNLEDFKNQYYKQVDNKPTNEVVVELNTDNEFWKVLVQEQLDNSINIFNNIYQELKAENFSQVFLPEFGNIKRLPSIKRTGVGQYELEVQTNKTYIISDLNGELKIEETDE